MHNDVNQVKDFRLGERRDNPKEIDSKDLSGINRLEYVALPEIENLLREWEIWPAYSLQKSNCQTFSRDLLEHLAKASNAVLLHLPGTNEKISINSDQLIT